jgi:hypothetical protein
VTQLKRSVYSEPVVPIFARGVLRPLVRFFDIFTTLGGLGLRSMIEFTRSADAGALECAESISIAVLIVATEPAPGLLLCFGSAGNRG